MYRQHRRYDNVGWTIVLDPKVISRLLALLDSLLHGSPEQKLCCLKSYRGEHSSSSSLSCLEILSTSSPFSSLLPPESCQSARGRVRSWRPGVPHWGGCRTGPLAADLLLGHRCLLATRGGYWHEDVAADRQVHRRRGVCFLGVEWSISRRTDEDKTISVDSCFPRENLCFVLCEWS